jgi:site-specific DNA-methyltransferase (adenine-specific)
VTIEVIRGDCFELAPKFAGKVDLIVCDPPYGEILDEPWDHECYGRLGKLVESLLVPRGTAYVWGGVGTYRNRPFMRWLSEVEEETGLRLHNLITWGKKRAYGVQTNYLFTREECAMLVKGDKPKTFNIPLLDKLRGYSGYSEKYPAKSPYLRRTNVWTDVTELLRGKIHAAEKPSKLAEIMIKTSSNPGDLVMDLFAGSGSTGVAARTVGDRRCVLVEKSDCVMHDLGPDLTALREETIKARKAAPGISLEASRDQARRAMTGQK